MIEGATQGAKDQNYPKEIKSRVIAIYVARAVTGVSPLETRKFGGVERLTSARKLSARDRAVRGDKAAVG